jgi:hypothetical protein
MILQDSDDGSPKKILWERKDRYAIIAFLLLSVDGEMNEEGYKKFDAFMGITRTKTEGNKKFAELCKTSDMITRQGNAFLEELNGSAEYHYECIMEELDRVIDGSERGRIGDGYAADNRRYSFGMPRAPKRLEGNSTLLFEYLKLVFSDEDYKGNKKRFLKTLARKWGIDKSVLPTLETSAKALDGIACRRLEIQESDMPHREAVGALAELESKETAVREDLKKMQIAKKQTVSSSVAVRNALIEFGVISIFGINGLLSQNRNGSNTASMDETAEDDDDDDAEDEDDTYGEETIAD